MLFFSLASLSSKESSLGFFEEELCVAAGVVYLCMHVFSLNDAFGQFVF